MPDRPLYVVDASVVARWYLSNPPYIDLARQVRDDYAADRIALTAPDNLAVEVGGAIHQAVAGRAIRANEGAIRYRQFLDFAIPTVLASGLLFTAFQQSVRYGCSFYDAIYLVLAESERVRFLHADHRLHATLDGRFDLELWIEDYRSG
jgi:predicted nucleic acid-binding protein